MAFFGAIQTSLVAQHPSEQQCWRCHPSYDIPRSHTIRCMIYLGVPGNLSPFFGIVKSSDPLNDWVTSNDNGYKGQEFNDLVVDLHDITYIYIYIDITSNDNENHIHIHTLHHIPLQRFFWKCFASLRICSINTSKKNGKRKKVGWQITSYHLFSYLSY